MGMAPVTVGFSALPWLLGDLCLAAAIVVARMLIQSADDDVP